MRLNCNRLQDLVSRQQTSVGTVRRVKFASDGIPCANSADQVGLDGKESDPSSSDYRLRRAGIFVKIGKVDRKGQFAADQPLDCPVDPDESDDESSATVPPVMTCSWR